MAGPLFGRGSGRLLTLLALASLVVLMTALVPSAASATECTDTWKGPAEGNWATAANWSTGKVPSLTDVACIGSGKTVTVSSGEPEPAGLQSEGTVIISGGRLGLTGTSTMRVLKLAGGRIAPEASFSITETFTWTAGFVGGSTPTVLSSGASGTISGISSSITGRLTNQGSVSVTGSVQLFEKAELRNEGTLTINSELSGTVHNNKSAIGTTKFVNTGTLQKTAGSGTTSIEVITENSGTVVARSGTISFNAGSPKSSGNWEGVEGGHVALTGLSSANYYQTGGNWVGAIEVGSPAEVEVEGLKATGTMITLPGVLRVPTGTLKVGTVAITTGRLAPAAPATIEIENSLLWNTGAVGGFGRTVILPGAEAIAEGLWSPITDGHLINRGTLNVKQGISMFGPAEIVNEGTMTVNSEPFNPSIRDAASAENTKVVNAGVLQKTAGTGTTRIESHVEMRAGSITAVTGKLEIEHPLTAKAGTATPGQACYAEPVNCATGNFFETQSDFAIGGRGVGLDLTRTYNAQTAAAGALGIFGYGWTNSFGDKLTAEESGAKQTLTDSSGATTTFTKSGASWVAPSWSADLLTGPTESGFTLILRDQTKEKFNGSGRLESVADRNGNETTLAYNGSGKLETITDPTGRKITLTYNGEGLVEKAKDPMGHEDKYAYESKQLKSVTLPGEASPNWQFKYDGSHRMTSFTDGRGGKTTNEYDAANRVISQVDPMERKSTFEYTVFHTAITNGATGAVTNEWFNSNNQPLSITRGYGTAAATTESFGYTAAGLRASKTDGNGHTTTYEYDAYGNRVKETDPEGDETKWTYNEAHQVLTESTPRGEKTTITRDTSGNPETVSRPAPESKTQTVSFKYGPHGEIESMTEPLSHAWGYEYDKYGDRIAATDPEGNKRTWAYDEESRPTSSVSPRGNEEGAEPTKFTTSIERDARGRPIKITDPLGGITKYAYDADGNVESVTDPNGRKTKFTYDADNELTKVEHPNKSVEETGYDGAGAVTSQTDGNKAKTTYVRNILEQPVEVIDPLERKTVQTFDLAGNVKTLNDPDGRTTTYGYDKADRLTGINYSDGITPNATYSYDKDGNLTGMTDGTGTGTYEYDQLDRLTHSKDSNGDTVSWEYNLGNQPVGLTYPNGKLISRAYDKAGRLESVTDWLGHTTTFAYNRDSAPTATTFPVGTTDTDEYGYDRADRVSAATMKRGAEDLASLAYSRDPAGQLESLIGKGLPGTETESFSYDENERLTKAGGAEFEYDPANNPTKAPGTTNAFDKASQLESATGATFTYDKEGERTKRTPSSGPATTYKYDQAGDLTAVERSEEGETPAIAESFGYDAAGLLASRTVGLSTRHFVWDLSEAPEPLLSDEEDSYVYGPGGLAFEQISSEEVPTYLHRDQLGSTRVLTNGSGEVTGTFTYGAYGALSGKTGTATAALGYAGQYTLGQSGLQYLRARFYDPVAAQFLTLDPQVAATRAPFFYGNDNPVNRRDRTGQTGEAIEGGCPSPICYPFPTSAEAGRAGEAIEELGDEIGGNVSSAWNSIFGGSESKSPEESSKESPPCAEPRPPGHDSETWERRPGSREGSGEHWWDPEGGEWGWHAPDSHHPEGHWNYNPWRAWNDEWQNIFP